MTSVTKQTLQIFWKHAAKYKLALFLIMFGIVAATVAQVASPLVYKNIFNLLDAGPATLPALYRELWLLLGIYLATWIFWRLASFATSFLESRVMADLAMTCFDYIHRHSYSFFTRVFVGSLVRKANRYTSAFEAIADRVFFEIGLTALYITFILAVLFAYKPIAGAVILAWIALYTAVITYLNRRILPKRLQRAEMDTKTSGYLADTVTNNLNVKLFTALGRETAAYRRMNDALHRLRLYVWNYSNRIELVQSLLMIVLEVSIMYFAIRQWSRGSFSLGDIALIQSYLIVIIHRLWDIGRQLIRTQEQLADANEMTQILLLPHEITDTRGAGKLRVPAGEIRFEQVRFGYSETQAVFKNLNLVIQAGQRVALVGPSGGGKTTIVKMLLRFHDVQRGRILIDDQDIACVTQDSLRASLALVPQEPILFHRTLLENIRYGRPQASRRQVIQAAKLAHCHEFISNLPDEYETLVGERGIKLSGGERQRVAIARAILKNAPVLILDEATSSLDSESEMYIQDALKPLMRDKTTIVIAHRLSTIMQMDRIIVLENGAITEDGSHQELLKAKQGTYQKLWDIQAGSFSSP